MGQQREIRAHSESVTECSLALRETSEFEPIVVVMETGRHYLAGVSRRIAARHDLVVVRGGWSAGIVGPFKKSKSPAAQWSNR